MAIDNENMLDECEITGTTSEGDEEVTTLRLSFNPDEGCWELDREVDGQIQDSESFEVEGEARKAFVEWTRQIEDEYRHELWAFENARKNRTAESLREFAEENAREFASESYWAIMLLSNLIGKGRAAAALAALDRLDNKF